MIGTRKLKSKVMAMFLAFLTVMGAVPFNIFAQDVEPMPTNIPIEPTIADGATGQAVLTQGMALANAWLNYAGGPIGTGMYSIVVDGQTFLGFCIDARRPGPSTAGTYNITVSTDQTASTSDGNVTIAQISAILNRGYPARKPQELGLNTSMEAYYATRMAIAMHVNYTNISLWSARPGINNSQAVLAAALSIGGFPAPNSIDLEQTVAMIIPFAELERFSGGYTTTDDGRTLLVEVTPEQARLDAILHRMALETINADIEAQNIVATSELTITAAPPTQVAQTEGDRLISPTWYTVTNSNGGFTVEWTNGVAGARIYNDANQVVATYPQNATFAFDTQFRISVPAGTPTGSVSVDVVGTPFEAEASNEFMFAIPTNSAHQPIIFRNTNIPDGGGDDENLEHDTPVTLTWTTDTTTTTPPPPEPTPSEPVQLSTAVQITKINELTSELIPGASVRLRGISNQTIILPDGSSWQLDNTGIDVTVVMTEGHALPPIPDNPEGSPVMNPVEQELADGVWTLRNLPFGAYIVYEVAPPENFSILPAQNHGGAYAFWLAPPNLSISQGDAGEDADEPEVMINWDDFRQLLMELAGIDIGDEPDLGDILGILAEILEDLELQVILPDHMTNPDYEIEFDPVVSSIQVQFRNYPYGAIEVTKLSTATGQGLGGAHFTLQGYAVAPDRHSTQVITRTGVTGEDGTFLFENLPAGHFTITEVQPPTGYMLGVMNDPHSVTQGVSVSWGDTAEVIFRNDPLGYLEITKVDGVTGELLDGAVFELTGHSGTQHGVTSGGIIRFDGLTPGHQYVVREISPPPGFVLMEGARSITISPGTNTMVWENWRNPTLTIIKVDQDTEARLAGAHFTVTFEDGSIPNNLPELITNENGEIVIDGALLDWNDQRTLIITEIVPPHGYHLGTQNWQTVTLRAGYNQTVVFRNQRRPTITINKIDSVLGTPIANAVFHIEKLDEPERGPLTGNPFRTDANGQIVLPIRHAGRYLIREIQAAPNYFLDPQQSNREWIIDVLPNEDYYLTIENTLLPTLVITKMNMVNHRPVPLTWFRVYYEVPFSNQVVFVTEQMTNERGQIILPFVSVGWYRIIETRPAPGMSLNVNNSYRIFLDPGRNSYQLLQQGLLPRQFDYLLGDNAPTIEIPSTGETNSPNEDLDIPANEVEQLPPQENPLPDDVADMPMTGTTPTVSDITGNMQWSDGSNFRDPNSDVWNWPLNSIIIRKIDNRTGELLPNATFNLIHISQGQTGTQGQVVGTFTTNHTGVIVITGLLPGSYAVEEISPPPNFTLSGQTRQLAWLAPDNHSIVELTFANEPFGSLLVSLRDEVTGEPLQNGEFRVTNSAGQVVGTANGLHRTNQQGEFLIPNLPPDTYIVTQTLAPNGYTFGSVQVHQTILVPATGQTYRLEFTNQPYSALIIRKLDSFDSSPIPGAIFRVNRTNGELIGEFTTDQLGTIEITGLLGHFTITELFVPAGFERDTTTVRNAFVMPQAPSIVTFFSPRLGSLTIEAIDGFGTPVAGAGFRVSHQNGELVGVFTSPASGIINLPTLTSGWYVVEPISPPTDFITADTGRSVDVQPNSAPRTTFVYHRLSILTIEAVDGDTGSPLAGVQFEVRRPSGERVSLGTTNNAGVFIVNNIDPTAGALIIEPISAPTGFVINEQARTVTLALGQNLTERFRAYRMGSMIIELTTENGNPLQGGRFRVIRPNGTVVGDFTTPASGLISINNLESGTYIVEQIAPPTNWVMTETGRTVEVVATQTTRAQFTNTQRPSLIIEKVDPDGNPLQGAEFEIRTINGALVQRVVTNNGGVATVANLEPGVYLIEETRAPQGFVITEGARTVEFVAGQNLTERFVNHRSPSLIIEKVDENGTPLQGAEFEIRTLAGALVQRVTTNSGGIATITDLAPGTYILEETRPPQGFVITESARTIEFVAGHSLTERFVNLRASTLTIEKVDTEGNPLANAEFEIRSLSGELLHRATTNNGGIITIADMLPQTIVIQETRAPQGFVMDSVARTVEIVAGQNVTERFVNHRSPSLIIEKVDENGAPLGGAEFEIRRFNGELVHRAVSNNAGLITIEHLEPGAYQVIETRAPEGHTIIEPSRAIEITAGETRVERFINPRLATFVIHKVDGVTGESLQGVVFEITTLSGEHIRNPQNGSFEFVTDASGMIRLPQLEAGSYVATETRALTGYRLAEPLVFQVGHDRDYIITIRNFRYPDYTIRKLDGHTNEPLEGVQFEIAHFFGGVEERLRNPRDGSFIWTTDGAGLIRIPHLPHGTYVARELRPLPGFQIADPVIFVVNDFEPTTLTIHNYRYSIWNILKLDGHTEERLQGVVFEVARLYGTGHTSDRLRNPLNGSFEFVTGANGMVTIGSLEPGTWVITETRALAGFIIAEPQVITVGANTVDTTITFRNYRMGDINILKIDGDTNRPLQGVVFEIHRTNGERVQNPSNNGFEFITDNSGRINLGFLPVGSYIAVETRALAGYQLADPVPFEVMQGRDLTLTIRNFRQAELTIRKINSITREPLQGVHFQISRPDGTMLTNPRTGGHDFITDSRGIIYLPNVEDGVLYVRETRALPGFLIDEEVTRVIINAESRNREHLVTIENTPAAGLLIIATNEATGEPLQGIEFEIRHADGRLVTGLMFDGNQRDTGANSPQLSSNGLFVTDARGRINLNHLEAGVYHVRVTSNVDGMQANDTVYTVTVRPGEQALLEVRLNPLAGLRLTAVDAITGVGLFNVEFMVFDSNNHNVGVFRTDNNGVIDFSHILNPGRYTIRLTSTVRGYSSDEIPRTVEFVAGRITEVVWEFMPQAGQIQIQVVSGDDNFNNALPAGTPLEGAIFEVFEARTGNLVDRFVSTNNGMAVSSPLPLGRYIVRQVQAPPFYMLNPNEMHVEIEFEMQIVRITYPNFSANMAVTVRVTGPQQVTQGQPVVYEIMQMMNESTTALADFYWRATLPVEAVRADRLITGTYNQNLRYRVLATTNTGREIVVADNLSTTRNNVVELAPVHLGLGANEFIVDFILHFGQVNAGFMSIENPRIFANVLPRTAVTLPPNVMFALLVDVGGRVQGSDEWVLGNNTTAATLWSNARIPQSGW